MKLWRTPWGRALLLGVVFGVAGVLIGVAVGGSRGADLTTSAAWGLYIAGALLLFFGATPLRWAPPQTVLVTFPEGSKEHVMQGQRDRIVRAPWALLNFFVAATLIGIGALLEIYG